MAVPEAWTMEGDEANTPKCWLTLQKKDSAQFELEDVDLEAQSDSLQMFWG